MDKVSIIIPIYNTKKIYLIECLNSIKEQTYKNIEIIMVDDGSNDITSKVCDEIAKSDNRIKIFHKKNEGVSVARNFGIENATGEWICFVDSDDWMEKDGIENFLGQNEKKDIIISNIFIDNEKVENKATSSKISGEQKIELIDCLLSANSDKYKYLDAVWGKLFKRELLKDKNIIFISELSRGEDTLFNLEVFYKAKEIGIINACTYHYRTNDESVTNKYDENIIKKYNCLIKKLKEKLDSFSEKKFVEQYFNFIIRCLDNLCRNYIYNENNSITKEYKNYIIKSLSLEEPYCTAIKKVKSHYLSKRRKLLVYLIRLNFWSSIYYIYK